MTKFILSIVLIAASSFAMAADLDAKGGKKWECKAKSETGRVFTSRSTNRIWAAHAALAKCEDSGAAQCWRTSCHYKAKDKRD